MDPNELVCAAKSGNTEAFERLVNRYYGLAYMAAFRTVGDAGIAKDLTQDAFVTAWTKLASLKQAGAFPIWLRRITRNLALTWIKNEQYRQRLLEHYGNIDTPAQEAVTPDVSAQRAERRSAVMHALESLSPKLRDAVVAFYLEEQSTARAAEALGITQNTLKKRLSRARALLRDHFESILERELSAELAPQRGHDRSERARNLLALGPAFPSLSDRVALEALPSQPQLLAHRATLHATRIPRFAMLAGLVTIGAALWFGYDRFSAVPTPSAGSEETVRTTATTNAPVDETATSAVNPTESPAFAPRTTWAPDAPPSPAPLPTIVTGIVRNEANDPVPNATVRLMLSNTWSSAEGLRNSARSYEYYAERYRPSRSFETATGDDGRYEFTLEPADVPSGADNFAGANLLALSENALGARVYAVLEVGKEAEYDLSIKYQPEMVNFRGRLLGPNGSPVTDAVVGVLADFGNTSLLDRTDGNGEFELMADGAGYANLIAVSPTHGEALLQYVHLQPGGPYTVEWPQGATVTGRLSWPDGRPATNVEVLLAGRFELRVPRQGTYNGIGYAVSAYTDGEGRYEIAGVPSPLDVSIQLYESEATSISPTVHLGDLPIDTPVVWDHVIATPIVVSGVAIGALSGAPIPNIPLSALHDGAPVGGSTVSTDKQGRFEMRLLAGAGRYTIYPHMNVPEEHAANAVFGQTFTFAAGEPHDIELRVTDPVTVRLQVIDDEGNGVEATGVVGLISYDEFGEDSHTFNTNASFSTDQSGFVQWTPVMPGQEFMLDINARGNYIEARTDRFVGQPGQSFDVAIIAYESSSLTGRVVGEDGNPLASAHIEVYGTLPDRTERLFNRRVDENGWFQVVDVAPATRYQLTINAEPEPGVPLESQPIPIDGVAGETVDIGTVTLRPVDDSQ